MKLFRFVLGLSLGVLCLNSYAELRLPHLISDGMVVQRFEPIPVWGWASPNQSIHITFADESKQLTTDSSGYWRTEFAARKEGGPFSLTIKTADDHKIVSDILVGDVWVCSGQSNMEWLLRDADNANTEIPLATDKNIRHFKVPKSWAVTAEQELAGGEWQVNSPETTANFTAVGYFFAKSLREQVDVPIGLLHSSWGGSNIESWMAATLLGIDKEDAQKNLATMVVNESKVQERVKAKVSKWPTALVNSAEGLFESATGDWSAKDVDLKDWILLKAPSLWENSGFQGLDGVAWYRKEFTLSKQQAAEDMTLHLARIDDVDITWVNGVKVGSTDVYSHERHYHVAHELLHEGRNVIAVRVIDTGGGGGIYSESALSFEQNGMQRSLVGDWFFKVEKGVVSLAGNKNHTATALFNKMMNPLFRVPVKGVLWYQGESNAGDVAQAFAYRDQFKQLITYWRSRWNQPHLPFYWVQLANFISGNDHSGQSPWAVLRESQSDALSLPNTGQAVTIDVGNPTDIHPRDKQTVGHRLALIALNETYAKKSVAYNGPVLKATNVVKGAMVLTMKTPSILAARDSHGSVGGFAIAGKDKVFYSAQATINGDKIIVSSKAVPLPASVRYAWSDNPDDANLMDANGLPASPFRTDSWSD